MGTKLPLFWLLQRGPFERYYMRLMWRPDGVMLIESARRLWTRVVAHQSTST